MFFLTYLRRELRHRMRQAVVTALGLAVGVGLVITVIALSSGVRDAQGKVLGALFGVGTDITVTTATTPASSLGQITPEPYVQHPDVLSSPTQGPLAASAVSAISRLRDVSAADVGAVTVEISRLLPSARVTNSASLAGAVAGSLKTTARLARRLGTWLAVLALLAAVAVASLLTLARSSTASSAAPCRRSRTRTPRTPSPFRLPRRSRSAPSCWP